MTLGNPPKHKRPNTLQLLSVVGTVMLLTSGFFFLGGVKAFQLPSMYRMVKHGGRADGWITEKTTDHGGNVSYSFQVDGHVYSGRGGMEGGIQGVLVGDHVSVSYDPENPAMSSLGATTQEFREDLWILAVASILTGLLCTAFFSPMWYIWKQKRLNAFVD